MVKKRHSGCYKSITLSPKKQAKCPVSALNKKIEKSQSFIEKTLDISGRRWYYNTRSAPVAQLDRVSDYESEGREFESLPAHQNLTL